MKAVSFVLFFVVQLAHVRTISSVFIVILAGIFSGAPSHAGKVTELSVPIGSSDASSYPLDDNVWSVQAPPFPFNVNIGIGQLLNSTNNDGFALHDHVYIATNVPDPARAVVTYAFDTAVIVDQVEILQWVDGITKIQGFAGNSLASFISLGSILGPSGDVTGEGVFPAGESQVFDFNNRGISGTYFQFVVLKTSRADGWASYRAFPRGDDGMRFEVATIPEPSSYLLMACGLLLLVCFARARRAAQGNPVAGPVGCAAHSGSCESGVSTNRYGKDGKASAGRYVRTLALLPLLLAAGAAMATPVLDQHNDTLDPLSGGLAVAL